jgi:hypothetical protein
LFRPVDTFPRLLAMRAMWLALCPSLVSWLQDLQEGKRRRIAHPLRSLLRPCFGLAIKPGRSWILFPSPHRSHVVSRWRTRQWPRRIRSSPGTQVRPLPFLLPPPRAAPRRHTRGCLSAPGQPTLRTTRETARRGRPQGGPARGSVRQWVGMFPRAPILASRVLPMAMILRFRYAIRRLPLVSFRRPFRILCYLFPNL